MLLKHGLAGLAHKAAGGGGGTFTLEQNVSGVATTNNSDTDIEFSGSITIGSGTDRVLVAAITLQDTSNAASLSATTFTFGTAARSFGTGSSMSVLGPNNIAGGRVQVAFAVLINPPSGAGTVQMQLPETIGSAGIWLYEFTGADQTFGNYSIFGNGSSPATTLSSSATISAGAMVSGLCLLSGDYTGEIAETTTATISGTQNTGTTGFSDQSCAFAHEVGLSAGTDGHTFTWTTSVDSELATLNIPEA